jgi:membrane protein implicated in regulation of membrane protease activity
MTELFQSLSAFTVFLSIAAFGFVFLVISFVFGEIFDAFGFDHDFDHDGGLDHGGGGPSFFSPRVLSVFVTAFGGAGAVATYYGLSSLASSAVGFVSGIAFGTMILMFARFLYGQQATTEVKSTDVIGQVARVVVGIPKGGVGQVRCRVGDELIDKIARSDDGQPIPENVSVRVEQVLGEIVIVKKA